MDLSFYHMIYGVRHSQDGLLQEIRVDNIVVIRRMANRFVACFLRCKSPTTTTNSNSNFNWLPLMTLGL